MATNNPPDLAHNLTENTLARLERRIIRTYSDAHRELQETIDAYFENLVERDKQQRDLLEAGKIDEAQYRLWRMNQIARGERFEALRDKVAQRYTDAREIAQAYINDQTPGVYSLNRNYAAYTIEKVHGNVGFTLWDESTVRRLLTDEPDLMPYYPVEKAVDRGIDLTFGREQISRATTAGIVQGKSLGRIADDLQGVLESMSRTAALRAARTAMTSAQNGGRMDSYLAAEKMGIHVRKRWIATKDSRTRHSHGLLDGTVVDLNEPFVSVLGSTMMFPGDQKGAVAADLYNCRCTMATVEKEGIEAEPRQMRVRDPKTGQNVLVNEMTYTEWKEWVKSRGG